MMHQRTLGQGLRVSALGLGCATRSSSRPSSGGASKTASPFYQHRVDPGVPIEDVAVATLRCQQASRPRRPHLATT
jgi:hypothetical protein